MCCHKCDVSLIFPHYFFNICGNCRDVISIPDNFCFLFILSKSDQKILIFFFNLLKETFLGCISFSVVFHFSISLISIKICNFFLLIHLKWGYFIISLMSIRIALSLSLLFLSYLTWKLMLLTCDLQFSFRNLEIQIFL